MSPLLPPGRGTLSCLSGSGRQRRQNECRQGSSLGSDSRFCKLSLHTAHVSSRFNNTDDVEDGAEVAAEEEGAGLSSTGAATGTAGAAAFSPFSASSMAWASVPAALPSCPLPLLLLLLTEPSVSPPPPPLLSAMFFLFEPLN
ncbi:hypothetical protein GDO81_006441 [Engystomops pustulosus]|uniref:Uncharacterized protein n=1 Tax=Engystomops pustulosus TaxID=76066 RepID=A0AAV7CWN1_ENGPU|nr:hypothetical protein GDO81_006441 [Engystomops pustulosus]